MVALCAALAPEFGEAKVFRPYRDVRFAKDKTPYKTAQGAFVAAGPATGWYVEISAARRPHRRRLLRRHRAPDRRDPRRRSTTTAPGAQLEPMMKKLEGGGWRIGGRPSRPRRAATTSTIRGSTCCATSR